MFRVLGRRDSFVVGGVVVEVFGVPSYRSCAFYTRDADGELDLDVDRRVLFLSRLDAPRCKTAARAAELPRPAGLRNPHELLAPRVATYGQTRDLAALRERGLLREQRDVPLTRRGGSRGLRPRASTADQRPQLVVHDHERPDELAVDVLLGGRVVARRLPHVPSAPAKFVVRARAEGKYRVVVKGREDVQPTERAQHQPRRLGLGKDVGGSFFGLGQVGAAAGDRDAIDPPMLGLAGVVEHLARDDRAEPEKPTDFFDPPERGASRAAVGEGRVDAGENRVLRITEVELFEQTPLGLGGSLFGFSRSARRSRVCFGNWIYE